MKQNYILYAGSYAASEEAGIHGYRLIRGEGGEPRLTEVFAAAGVSNPSYLAVSSDGRFLYSVMEDMTYEGRSGGGVAAFRIHRRFLTHGERRERCRVICFPMRSGAFCTQPTI